MRFRGAASIVAVCEFCRSTLVREGAKLEDIGKQAELLDDASPLQLGVQGRHRGVEFNVVGRIQYRYRAGAWNEWYLLFARGRNGWLSDADGKYRVSYLRAPEAVPPFGELSPGRTVRLQQQDFEVTNVEQAEVVSGEGELPFKFMGGWKAPVADLRGAGTLFATIDYSEAPPRIYTGEELPFDTFRFAGLRDPRVHRAGPKARAFACPNCGAPVQKRLQETQTIGCERCGAALDTSKDEVAIVAKHAEHTRFQPSIPLGSRAKFQSHDYEVVGYLERATTADGTTWTWGEYLLHNPEQGYRWITQYNGHFNMVHACAELPRPAPTLGPPQLRYLGRNFTHFQSCEARVTYLVGEFNWRVGLGDTCKIMDYVAPPLMLSSERTDKEVTWSIGEYVDGENLWQAFRLKTPRPQPSGIFANQPSPHEGRASRYFKASLLVLAAAAVVQLALWLTTDSREVARLELATRPHQVTRAGSEVFELRGWRPVRLAIVAENRALEAGEVDLDLTLVNAQSGDSWQVGQSVWNVYGIDDGEAWSDRRARNVAHARVPPGRYTVSAQAYQTAIQQRGAPTSTSVTIYRASPDLLNLGLLAAALLVAPLVAWWRSRSFESARWAESDYAADEAEESEE